MTEKYFDKFPTINYNGQTIVDITKRAVVLNSVYNNPNLYYLYNVNPGERPDNVAYNNYDDPYMSWILYLTNNITDPYYQWAMDTQSFNDFLTMKYGSIARAMNKVKYYRNNWADNPDPISVQQFESLSATLQDYYEPNYGGNETNSSPLNYTRKQADWSVTTNSIAGYNVANGNGFILDEIVNVVFDTNNVGQGQVNFANSSYISLQHLSGVTTTGTISVSSYLYGTESLVNTAFTSAVSIANTISSLESSYWSPVYYYDYENELNANTMNIKILKPAYTTEISQELNKLLNS
jgi:hypothetical protein